MSALARHLFLYDRGNMLQVLEESGLSTTQTKTLFELGGLGEETSRARSATLPRPSASRSPR